MAVRLRAFLLMVWVDVSAPVRTVDIERESPSISESLASKPCTSGVYLELSSSISKASFVAMGLSLMPVMLNVISAVSVSLESETV